MNEEIKELIDRAHQQTKLNRDMPYPQIQQASATVSIAYSLLAIAKILAIALEKVE